MTQSTAADQAPTRAYRAARDQLLSLRGEYDRAVEEFRWPDVGNRFNWAVDWFDAVARGNDRLALVIVEEDGGKTEVTFDDMSRRSDKVARWLSDQGVALGDSVIVMLGNQVELWEAMLAIMKLGAVTMPTTTAVAPSDLVDRIERGNGKHVVCNPADAGKFRDVPGDYTRICVGSPEGEAGWLDLHDAYDLGEVTLDHPGTGPDDRLLLYFTSGTTSRPKLVEHTQVSYPVGHLSTMYWLGLQPGDVHLNISSPGWAKHAWSCFFAPWIAEATVFLYNYTRFDAPALLEQLREQQVTSFCAPPTVWRMLINADLSGGPGSLREVIGAGEPLNPEVIEQVSKKWGLALRDGYGQTEMTAAVGNSPGAVLKPGSMGRALPGCPVAIVDPLTGNRVETGEGEICLDLSGGRHKPLPLMTGYQGDPTRNTDAIRVAGTTPVTSPPSTTRGTSPTSDAPTTSSRRRTTRSARSSSRACSSSTRQLPRRPSCPPRTRCGSRFRRRTSSSRPATSRTGPPPSISSSTRASTWRPTNGFVASSSRSCRKPSPERFVVSSYAPARTSSSQVRPARPVSRVSGATTSSPS